jgi:hypothetical protein
LETAAGRAEAILRAGEDDMSALVVAGLSLPFIHAFDVEGVVVRVHFSLPSGHTR